MKRHLSLLLAAVLACGLVSLAAAQQQDQSNRTAPDPLVQLLQSKGVLTAQEATAINQAATPAEQQNRLTQLLYSKGFITQDEYKTAAAAESRAAESQGTWLPAAAHVSAGGPEPAMAMPPQAPAAPAIIPGVAPVRVLTSDPPKAGGMVPDLKLGSGAKVKLYGFVKSTAAYDSSNPYGIDFVLPGLGGTVNGALPGDVPTGLTSPFTSGLAGVGDNDSGPNGSPTFYLKGSATRMGANLEWPDIAGANNTITGRIEADFEGNFSRSQNRNVSSVRTRMLSLRLAYARVDHKFSEDTTGFMLFGMDWTPFGSSTVPNLLETTENGAFSAPSTNVQRRSVSGFGTTSADPATSRSALSLPWRSPVLAITQPTSATRSGSASATASIPRGRRSRAGWFSNGNSTRPGEWRRRRSSSAA